MLKTYLKWGWRSIRADSFFSIINILGLFTAFSACLLIAIFVYDELQYDKQYSEEKNVYRLYNNHKTNENSFKLALTSPQYAESLQNKYPEIVTTSRVYLSSNKVDLIEAGNTIGYEENGLKVDSTFLEIFPLKFALKTAVNPLAKDKSIVLSEVLARKYFKDRNPLGQTIKISKENYTVTGIFETPANFHLSFNYLLPLHSEDFFKERSFDWNWKQFYTYIQVIPDVDLAKLVREFNEFVAAKEDELDMSDKNEVVFQPLSKIHLYSSDIKYDISNRGNINYVKTLSFIAIFILIIACFNFFNLSSAKSIRRSKNIMIRKIIGSSRLQLLTNYLAETFIIIFLSMLIALIVSYLCLPLLNQLTSKSISANFFAQPMIYWWALALVFVVIIIAAIYPAINLSIRELGKYRGGTSGRVKGTYSVFIRHSLIVTQLVISILLTIGSLAVYLQVKYLYNRDLGFQKEELMLFNLNQEIKEGSIQTFKERLAQISNVKDITVGYGFPGDRVPKDWVTIYNNGIAVKKMSSQILVDYDYINTLGIEVIAGRAFNPDKDNDRGHAFMINEAAVEEFGYKSPKDAIGEKISWEVWNNENWDEVKEGSIIGVVKDYNLTSLYEEVETTVLHIFPDAAQRIAIKISAHNLDETTSDIKAVWEEFSPGFPFSFTFLEKNINEMYAVENNLKILLSIFACLAICLACVGLFGITAYASESRKTEIGIRKILGASTTDIVFLFSMEFLQLVVLAFVISSPIAYYIIAIWLDEFAYHINIEWWVFGITLFFMLSIVSLIIAFQTFRSAQLRPVSNLNTL